MKDRIGTKHGRLLILSVEKREKGRFYHCLCDCGTNKLIQDSALRRTLSCGCLNAELKKSRIKHGMKRSPKYSVWGGILTRCDNEKDLNYKKYGARGITICDRWRKFENFYSDMGKRPSANYSIDRIDNSKGYFKENCRWATLIVQANNKTNNRMIEYNGKTQPLSQWAREVGIGRNALKLRLNRGWPLQKAFSTPERRY